MIRLRRLEVRDIPAFLAYRGDPEVARYQSWEPMEADEAGRMIAHMAEVDLFRSGRWTQLGIADDEDTLIGDMGLFLSEDGREAELGITLARRAQGKGFATQAVQQALGLVWAQSGASRVLGICDCRNTASLRLLARVGFVEGWRDVTDGIEEVFHVMERPRS